MTSAFSWQNSISLCPASFHTPRPNLPVTKGEGNGTLLQYSCLKILWMEEPGGLQSTGTQSQTQLSDPAIDACLQDLLELAPKKDVLFIIGDWNAKVGSQDLAAAAAATAKSLQSCPTLCDPIDGSPPGSAIPGILQARTLEWVAISFSNA